MNPVPDFDDAQSAYEKKSTTELMRASLSFTLCRIPILVRHAEPLLKFAYRLLGHTITDYALKHTLFGHFCAGQDDQEIMPKIKQLQDAGIGSILDYAAEDDGGSSAPKEEIADEILQENIPKVRVYDYESEAKCDRHVDTFVKCIHDVQNLDADGFAAVKVTALGNPKLLERMSRAIVEAQTLFAKFDENNDGLVSRDEFERGFRLFFKDEDSKLKQMLEEICPEDPSGDVDYITWSMMLSPRDLPSITSGCREVGPLSLAAPTSEEVELIEKMYERGHVLAQEAKACGTRLLIDAEQARFQPAIDNLVLDLQRKYNCVTETEFPIIYNTYQCYLKDASTRLHTDMERAERYAYHFGAKLVRGAYLESERALAESLGYPSPIHPTIEDTHRCYNDSVDYILERSTVSDKCIELMLATHNQESIEKAIVSMNKYGIDRQASTVCFGQLLGMADNLSFNLGKHGYRAFKYVPYGPIKMVMPYLIRRANENSALAGGTTKELGMIHSELKRRLLFRRA